MGKRQQIGELYYIRAIAAFGIFIIHATGGFALFSEFGSKAMWLGTFLNQFFRFGTPVFMMVSGFVLFYNYRTPDEFNPKAFYKKKFTFIIIPYVVWSIAYFLFSVYMYGVQFNQASVADFLRKLPVGDTFAHLYFIFLIVQFYVLFPPIIKYLSNSMKNKPLLVTAAVFTLQAVILIYEFYFKKTTNFAIINFINTYFWKTVIGWFFYFIMGGIFAYHYEKVVRIIDEKIKTIFVLYFGGLLLFVGEPYLNMYINQSRDYFERYGSIRPTNMIYAILTFAVLVWVTRRIKEYDNVAIKLFKSFGTYSLGVYFAHPMVLEFLKMKLMWMFPNVIGYGRVSSVIIIIGLGWILTMGLCYFIALFNWRWLLIGKVPSLLNKKSETKTVRAQ